MATEKQSKFRQVYVAPGESVLSSNILQIICVFSRRAIVACCYNAKGVVTAVQYMAYHTDKPIWDTDFFEYTLATDPVFANKEKISKVFILTDRELLIPEELYNEADSHQWLRHTYFIEPNDSILSQKAADAQAHLVYAVPSNIKELIHINFLQASILPLSYYLVNTPQQANYVVRCCLTGEQAITTLFYQGKILWHKAIEYIRAEDIAYYVRLVCQEHQIEANRLILNCNYLHTSEYVIVNELSQYFAAVRTGDGQKIEGAWLPIITLFQQLIVCG
ncbi:MAG: DUF3822 family protein [Chitinophagia bacterium]|nr:DUF3822 family protein [Chitinophagia bacterium]